MRCYKRWISVGKSCYLYEEGNYGSVLGEIWNHEDSKTQSRTKFSSL